MGEPEGDFTKFEVSFVGKERIPKLKQFLAVIGRKINEECIYLLTGADAWRIYPPK